MLVTLAVVPHPAVKLKSLLAKVVPPAVLNRFDVVIVLALSVVNAPVFGVVLPIAPGAAHGTCDCEAVPARLANEICEPLSR